MKKRLVIFCLGGVVPALLVWAVPVAVGYFQARPLQGCFMVARCGCGHEMFFLIQESQAFDYCPGHREKKLIGSVSRTVNFVSVFGANRSALDFELKLEDGRYYLKFSSIDDNEWNQVEQVTNPWRTSFRSHFPE